MLKPNQHAIDLLSDCRTDPRSNINLLNTLCADGEQGGDKVILKFDLARWPCAFTFRYPDKPNQFCIITFDDREIGVTDIASAMFTDERVEGHFSRMLSKGIG